MSKLKQFKIYFADERDNREFTPTRYVLCGATDRIDAYKQAFEAFPGVVKWGIIVEVQPTHTPQPAIIAPNPTPSAPQQHVQVQWWLSGARQGAYSQETYSVIESDNKWTAFHDALGRKHVVATDRVRFVASRKDQKAQKAQKAA